MLYGKSSEPGDKYPYKVYHVSAATETEARRLVAAIPVEYVLAAAPIPEEREARIIALIQTSVQPNPRS